MSLIPSSFFKRFTDGPSADKDKEVSCLKEGIAAALGDRYEVFLHGSFRNATALEGTSPVDFIALRSERVPRLWDEIFNDITERIFCSQAFGCKPDTQRKDLRIKRQDSHSIITPAFRNEESVNHYGEPLFIFDRTLKFNIKYFPRTHAAYMEEKDHATGSHYTKVVRMFKHFIRNHTLGEDAPSFYVECLLYHLPDEWFRYDLLQAFFRICCHICHDQHFSMNFRTIAQDKMVISSEEWHFARFMKLKESLANRLVMLEQAQKSQSGSEAERLVKGFFADKRGEREE